MDRIPRAAPELASPVSASWEWRKCKISPAPAGDSAPQALHKASRVRSRWLPITLTVQYRGGPESSWLVRCGTSYRRWPGYMAIEDVMSFTLREVPRWQMQPR